MKLCKCGCKCEIPEYNTFKKGHNRKGLHHLPNTLKKISKTNKRTRKEHPEIEIEKGKKISEFRTGKSFEQIYGKEEAIVQKEKRRKARLGKKGVNWAMTYSPKEKKISSKKTSDSMKLTIMKMLDEDPEKYVAWRKKNFISCFNRPSSLERMVIGMNIPCLRYVGNGKVWLKLTNRTCNPDFIIEPYNETKAVLEVFGGIGYFHSIPESKILKKEYSKKGIRSLIILETELKNPNIKRKIENFVSLVKNPQRLARRDY